MPSELRWLWLGLALARATDLLFGNPSPSSALLLTATLWLAAEAVLFLVRHLRWRP